MNDTSLNLHFVYRQETDIKYRFHMVTMYQ